jgi:hypothetical protein
MEPGVRFLHGLHREVPVWQAIPGSDSWSPRKCWKMMENDGKWWKMMENDGKW